MDDLFSLLPHLPNEQARALIGSTYCFGKGEDIDILILVTYTSPAINDLYSIGFMPDGDYEGGTFKSFRKDNINVIVTELTLFYDLFIRAMRVCKYLQLTNKADRIAVCKLIRDGQFLEQLPMQGASS